MIIPLKINYKELSEGSYIDKYIPQNHLFHQACSMTDNLRKALLSWAGEADMDKTAMYLMLDERKEIGRCYMFGSKVKAGEIINNVQCFFALEACEQYRNEGVGTSLMLFPLTNKEYDFVLIAGMTSKVIPMYRKLKYHVFEVPQYIKLQNARYILIPLGLKGFVLKFFSGLGNCLIGLRDIPNKIKRKKLNNKYIVKKETIVPEWAGELATNDGHKYMEVHDRKWLQWCLDNNTNGFVNDIQSFYVISDKNNKPLGFFMTKERFITEAGRIKDSIRGTVVEWGSYDKTILSEAVINVLALQTFSKNVDLIVTLATEDETIKTLKKIGFVQRGFYPIGFRDKKNVYKDANDQNLWRLRYGYTNMIIY